MAETEYNTANGWYRVGAENNGYFELVDFQKGDTLVSLKTTDTSVTRWQSRIEDVISELDSPRGEVNGAPANMVLDLRVQPGGFNAAQYLIEYGKSHQVTVQIKEYP